MINPSFSFYDDVEDFNLRPVIEKPLRNSSGNTQSQIVNYNPLSLAEPIIYPISKNRTFIEKYGLGILCTISVLAIGLGAYVYDWKRKQRS